MTNVVEQKRAWRAVRSNDGLQNAVGIDWDVGAVCYAATIQV